MDAYTLRRYFRNAPVGACLSRERLLLGLRNVCWRQGQHLGPEDLQAWIQALVEEFGLEPEEQRFLYPQNLPSPDGIRRLVPSYSRNPAQPKE